MGIEMASAPLLLHSPSSYSLTLLTPDYFNHVLKIFIVFFLLFSFHWSKFKKFWPFFFYFNWAKHFQSRHFGSTKRRRVFFFFFKCRRMARIHFWFWHLNAFFLFFWQHRSDTPNDGRLKKKPLFFLITIIFPLLSKI